MASHVSNYFSRYDVHRHLIEVYKNPLTVATLTQAMHTLFSKGARVQAVTDHSHDFWRLKIPMKRYIASYNNVERKRGYRKMLGMEINIVRRRKKGTFGIDLETIGDPAGKMSREEVIRNLEFAILSIHDYNYNSKGERVGLNLRSSGEYLDCLFQGIEYVQTLRNINQNLEFVLGHPTQYLGKYPKLGGLTRAQTRNMVHVLAANNVYPEINAKCFLGGDKGVPGVNQEMLFEMYIDYMLKEGRIPKVSFGTDNHNIMVTMKIEFEDLGIKGLEKAVIWCDKKGVMEAQAELDSAAQRRRKKRKSGRVQIIKKK